MEIILIISGSFNPPHYGHLEMLIKAKKYMEINYNCNVIHGFLIPSSDEHVKIKLNKDAISLEHRIQLCNLLIEDYDWIKVYPSGISSGNKNAKILSTKYKMDVYEIGGTDFINKTKINKDRKIICIPRSDYKLTIPIPIPTNLIIINESIKNISSTLIRNLIHEKKFHEINCTNENIIKYIIDNHLL